MMDASATRRPLIPRTLKQSAHQHRLTRQTSAVGLLLVLLKPELDMGWVYIHGLDAPNNETNDTC